MTKPFFGLFGKVVASFVTVCALFYTIEDFRAARAWEAERQRLEAKGEELSWAKLMPSPPLGASGKQGTPEVVPWKSPDLLSIAGFRPEFEGVGLGAGPDGLIAMENWSTMLRQPPPTAPDEPCAAGFGFLKAIAPLDSVIETLIEAARRGPVARWEVSVGEQPASSLLPPLLPVRRLNRLLRLRIAAHFACGESERAIDELRLMARLQESLKGLPFPIIHYMRLALADELLDGIHDGLSRGRLHEGHRREVAALISDDWFDSARLALRADRNWLIFYARAPELIPDTRTTHISGQVLQMLVPRGWLLRQAAHLARSTDEVLQLLDDPSRIDPAAIDRLPHGQAERSTPYNAVAKMVEGHVGRLARITAAIQTRVQLIRTAFALQTFREETGAYPQAISELAPGYVATVPTDITNGQPLRYRRTGKGFVVYGVGWDMRDDGGLPDQSYFASRRDWDLAVGAR